MTVPYDSPYGAPSGNVNGTMLTGIPQEDVVAEILQSPPGEDTVVGQAYDMDTIRPVLELAYRDLMQARAGYKRAENYANGLSPELFSDPRLRQMLGLSDSYAIPYGTEIGRASCREKGCLYVLA